MAQCGGKREGSGRPKGSVTQVTKDIRELARQYAPEAFARIREMAGSAENEQVRLKANEIIIERGWGRPQQSVDVTVRRPSELSDAELAAAAADAEAALAALGGLSGGLPGGTGETRH